MFWIIALAVVIVLGALAWWTSGRRKAGGGVDAANARSRISNSQADVGIRSGRPNGSGPIGPLGGP